MMWGGEGGGGGGGGGVIGFRAFLSRVLGHHLVLSPENEELVDCYQHEFTAHLPYSTEVAIHHISLLAQKELPPLSPPRFPSHLHRIPRRTGPKEARVESRDTSWTLMTRLIDLVVSTCSSRVAF